jgi:hypothetical protein
MLEEKSCDYCGSEFSPELLQYFTESNKSVFCENCGTEVVRRNEKISSSDLSFDIKSILKKIPRYINEKFRFEKNPILRVAMDSDFSRIFKDNFKLVASRIIYCYIRALEEESGFTVQNTELTSDILDTIFEHIKSLMSERLDHQYLENLNRISIREFEKWLQSLQAKLKLNKRFHQDFIIYLRWLTSRVYTIIAELWDAPDLPKFYRVIRDDLKFFIIFRSDSSPSLPPGIFKEVKQASLKLKNPYKLMVIVSQILNDLITGSKKLVSENLPLGFKRNPKYLASMLIYYGLRHEDYNNHHKKYRIYSATKYLNDFYPKDSTMKKAMTTLPSKVYDFLSDGMKTKILYFPRGQKNLGEKIKNKVKNLKSNERNEKFFSELKNCIKKYSEKLDDSNILCNLGLVILKDAFKSTNERLYSYLIGKIRYGLPKYYAVGFLFFALNHKSYENKTISISSYSDLYFKEFKKSNFVIISSLYEILSEQMKSEINYLPKRRYKLEKEFDENLVWEYFTEFLQIFDPRFYENLYENAEKLYHTAKLNGFEYDSLSSKNPKFLSFTLLFFSLLNTDSLVITKDSLYSKLRKNGFEISHTIADKVINKFEEYIRDSLLRAPRRTITQQRFKDLLVSLKEQAKEKKSTRNIVLYDLILRTLRLYKNDFEQFIIDISFISSQGTTRILERLSNPDVLDKELYLTRFISNYKELIDNLNVCSKDKRELIRKLKEFDEIRRNYYKFDESKYQKKKREKERYNKYRSTFFSFEVRVERFLLMLGFSPYDGFDLWENKIFVKGKFRIFANFHHYRYNPEEQSKEDLVFIPIKPPRNIRSGEYLTKTYLTHNVISGLEGHLRRSDISEEVRLKMLLKLQKIEGLIKYNSSLLEKAVHTKNHELLYHLRNWDKEDIKRAINRLKDYKFTWVKEIERYLPTAEGYDYVRISKKETNLIIKGIRK